MLKAVDDCKKNLAKVDYNFLSLVSILNTLKRDIAKTQ